MLCAVACARRPRAAIVENASGRATIRSSIGASCTTLLTRPLAFFRHRAFLWTYGLYFSTYFAANIIDSACEWLHQPVRMPKFLGVTAVNMTMVIGKDIAFTRMFSPVAPQPLPKASIGLFAVRD